LTSDIDNMICILRLYVFVIIMWYHCEIKILLLLLLILLLCRSSCVWVPSSETQAGEQLYPVWSGCLWTGGVRALPLLWTSGRLKQGVKMDNEEVFVIKWLCKCCTLWKTSPLLNVNSKTKEKHKNSKWWNQIVLQYSKLCIVCKKTVAYNYIKTNAFVYYIWLILRAIFHVNKQYKL